MIFYLRAKTNGEANDWHAVLNKHILFQNIVALQNGSRSPEIVEWYYQYQAEIYRRHTFLMKSTEVFVHFQDNGSFSSSASSPKVSIFNIAASVSYICMISVFILISIFVFCFL
jgi:hypothetical protein